MATYETCLQPFLSCSLMQSLLLSPPLSRPPQAQPSGTATSTGGGCLPISSTAPPPPSASSNSWCVTLRERRRSHRILWDSSCIFMQEVQRFNNPAGDFIRIRVKVKMFDPKMSGLREKMSAQRKSRHSLSLRSLIAFPLAFPQSDRFYHNASLLDSGHVQQTAAMLANATLHTEKYYGSDVKVAYRLMESLLQHESNQRGFNLTATQDVHFTEVKPDTQTRRQSNEPLLRCGSGPPPHPPPTPACWHVCGSLPSPQGHITPPPLCHPLTPTSRCLLTEPGPREQRHPVSRHAAALGAHPALRGRHGGAAAPLRGVHQHAGREHEEDLPQPLHLRHAALG